MDTHNNARLTPKGREDMVRAVVDRGLPRPEAARHFNTTWKTVDNCVKRFDALGVEGSRDRSLRPHSMPSQTLLATADAAETFRRDRRTQSRVAADSCRFMRAEARSCAMAAAGLSQPAALWLYLTSSS